MGAFGDFFPEKERADLAEQHLTPGEVLYLFCDFTTPPKEKYFIVASHTGRPLLFIINSEIHPYVAKRPHLNQCQVQLSVQEYDFLDHDSFANCSKVIDDFTKADIIQQISEDIGIIRGHINSATKKDIINAVSNSTTISRHHKNLIIQALQ